MDTDLRHRTIATNGINLHVVEAGPEDGRLVSTAATTAGWFSSKKPRTGSSTRSRRGSTVS